MSRIHPNGGNISFNNMATKKIVLSSEVKSRLRRAVLGGLDLSSPTKIKPLIKPVNNHMTDIYQAKPAAKTLKKIVIKPVPIKKSKPSVRIAVKPKINKVKLASLPKTAPIIKSAIVKVPLKPFVAAAKSAIAGAKPAYRPFAPVAKRAWEVPRQEESLEKLFSKTKKAKLSDKFDSFMKTAKPKKAPGNYWLKLIVAIIALVILLIAYWTVGIYSYGFSDSVSNVLAKTLYLPAGFVGNQAIGAGEYLDDYKLLAGPLSQKREGLIDYTAKTELSDRIFFRLAANKLVADKLAQYGQSVTQKDIDSQIAMLVKQAGSQAEAEKMINNLYGLKFDQFKSLVLLPMMARANLQAAIVTDESLSITAAAKARAEEVLRLALASSTDFSALAKQYTDDEAGVNTGGDLGWVVKGQLDANWESLIFSAATGTVITTPIKSGFGFHIVKVEQKLIDKTTGSASVKLRHILIKVDVDQYIKELLDNAKIIKYIK